MEEVGGGEEDMGGGDDSRCGQGIAGKKRIGSGERPM